MLENCRYRARDIQRGPDNTWKVWVEGHANQQIFAGAIIEQLQPIPADQSLSHEPETYIVFRGDLPHNLVRRDNN